MWLATSPDFLRWTDPTLILHSDEIDRNNRRRRIRALVDDPGLLTPPIVDETNHIAQIYKMPIMPYEGIYVGFPVVFNPAGAIPEPWGNFTAINQVELAVLARPVRLAARGQTATSSSGSSPGTASATRLCSY